jgi:DUF438 domain-containing protein
MESQPSNFIKKSAGGFRATRFYLPGNVKMERVRELTEILRRICAGEQIEKVVEQTKQFLVAVGPRDLALAERTLFESGHSVSYLDRLCETHLRIFGNRFSGVKYQLSPNHIIAKLLAEHELLLCFVADLEDVNYTVRRMRHCTTVSAEFRKIAHIAGHFAGFNEHRELEDEIIFPELDRRGCYGPLAMVKAEHLCIDISTSRFLELVGMAEGMDFRQFRPQLAQIVDFLVPAMREHVFKENNIFFPIALEVIDDAGAWERVRGLCDQIGYCSMHSGL